MRQQITYDPAEVLIHVREPFNKNTLWIHPHDGIIEVKVFDKKWIVIASTEDKGLSDKSEEQTDNLVSQTKNTILSKFKKVYSQQKQSMIVLRDRQKELEEKIIELENKLDKLTKRYATLRVKTN